MPFSNTILGYLFTDKAIKKFSSRCSVTYLPIKNKYEMREILWKYWNQYYAIKIGFSCTENIILYIPSQKGTLQP